MDRDQFVADLVERSRELAHDEAVREAERILHQLDVVGLGRSSAVTAEIKDSGVRFVNRVIQAVIDAEIKAGFSHETDAQRRLSILVDGEVKRETAWLRDHIARYGADAARVSGSLDDQVADIAADRLRYFQREARIALATTQLAPTPAWPPSGGDPQIEEKAAVTESLFSRLVFDRDLPDLLKRPENSPVALVLGDIDHFKTINDKYGHQKGDEALRVVANSLRRVVGARGRVYRHGGEEFAVILPNHSGHEATLLAERARNDIRGAQIEGVSTMLTMSFGVSAYPDCADTLDVLVSGADRALYSSKAGGRDRVTVAAISGDTAAVDNEIGSGGGPVRTCADDYGLSHVVIKQECESRWPDDFQMQSYCIREQKQAVEELRRGCPADVPAEVFTRIRANCESQWPRDFAMRRYCERQQIDAFRELR